MQHMVLKKFELGFQARESFKTLRSNIEFSGEDIRTIVFTSCAPSEGKSNTSFYLACAFAESGKSVLLIDADLRRSMMRRFCRRGQVRYGLVHALVGKSAFDDVRCHTDIPNLDLVFAGPVPPNPSELLGGKRFKEVLSAARREYHYIIVDTPPIGSVIDGAVVAKICDGTVLVVEAGNVSYRFAQKVKEQLEKAGCRIIGCVLNKVPLDRKGTYAGYYGRYYGKRREYA